MILRGLSALVCFGSLLFGLEMPCLTVDGDQITGKDLARALPAFAAVPPMAVIAPAPPLGGTRIFHQTEMQSIGTRFSVHLDSPSDVCFRLFTEPLNQDLALRAMRDSLRMPDASIEISEMSTEPAPRGRIEFPRERLAAPVSGDQSLPVLWRGFLIYQGNRHVPIWAKVWITAPVVRIVALDNLRQGVPIQETQVRREVTESFPLPIANEPALDQIVGLLPVRSIAAGAEVRAENLVRPNDVNKGDMVRVEVRIGAARLALNGRAEGTGRVGDFIAVLNPESSRTFQARVAGKDTVVVEPAGEN